MKYLKFILAGMYFGVLITKAEVISWYRIQEMFRFQSFHMYGVLGAAVAVGMLSVFLIRRFKLRALSGEPIVLKHKVYNKGYFPGGFLFGCGWAITGACPGPLFALAGNGLTVFAVTILFAVFGTFTYGLIRHKIPH